MKHGRGGKWGARKMTENLWAYQASNRGNGRERCTFGRIDIKMFV
jgi:hypothetical protein